MPNKCGKLVFQHLDLGITVKDCRCDIHMKVTFLLQAYLLNVEDPSIAACYTWGAYPFLLCSMAERLDMILSTGLCWC